MQGEKEKGVQMRNIGILGMQCTGKSTLASYLSQITDLPIFKWAAPLYKAQDIVSLTKNREFLEGFSDLAKSCFGDDIIFKAGLDILKNMQEEYRYVINDDLRYPHELKYALENNWYLVFVDAPEVLRKQRAEAQGLTFTENHASEHLFQKENINKVIDKCDLFICNNTSTKVEGTSYLKQQAERIRGLVNQ